MTDKHADIAEKLRVLKEAYATRLPEELTALKTLVIEAFAPAIDAANQQEYMSQLHQRLHKMAGSAGSFGFGEAGKQAKILEHKAKQWLDNPIHTQDVNTIEVFTTHLDQMIAQLAQMTEHDPPINSPITSTKHQSHHPAEARIFLLEDDLAYAEEISLTLRHFGHKVIHFETLAQAEKAIRLSPPDFLIVDIVFQQEGVESPALIQAIQREVSVRLPVIFISSRNDFDAYHAAMKSGAIGYFVKPFDVVRLADRLEFHLERRREIPYRVMIVDDDLSLVEHYRMVLESAGMLVGTVNDPRQVLTVLREFKPEMIMLDVNIPDYPGPELAKVIRLSDEWLRVPITYLSAETDIDQRVKAMDQAGDDFISKPISDRELVAAVSIRAARSRQLSDAMDRDGLSGLLKHSRIKEQVDVEVARARRNGDVLSVAMIDLDHFKVVNDTYGHASGDKVIKALAHLLRQRLRKTDSIGRYGGEEFVVVLPCCTQDQAKFLLDNVRESFQNMTFNADGRLFHVTLSAGIATMGLDQVTQADTLLQLSDDALYLAKHAGRNQICVS